MGLLIGYQKRHDNAGCVGCKINKILGIQAENSTAFEMWSCCYRCLTEDETWSSMSSLNKLIRYANTAQRVTIQWDRILQLCKVITAGNECFSFHSRHFDLSWWEKHRCLNGTLMFHLSVPVINDSVTVSQHAQYQGPETEAVNWQSVNINCIIYTCAFPAVSVSCEKRQLLDKQ